ncbi:MAG: T9SS type A sorting domain-containing protein [Bacteroidales bacterium]|nr:T9SS type A sorting domain-containing protein [Bacteroidales bacterium]
MKKYCQFLFVLALLVATAQICTAQVCGCTDSLAVNYDPGATVNDGGCVYATTIITADGIGVLDPLMQGSSSLLFWDNGFWTFNDHNDSCLYHIDSTSANILETFCINGLRNDDVEEISQDSLYLYFGDVGNNSGSRQDLQILRISKESILNQMIVIDTIRFFYEDQADFTANPQATDFDCEAFIVTDDSIYVFTKEWVSTQTTIYSIPKTPGTHIAHRRESYDVHGLITGASYMPEYQLIVLCGYDYDPVNLLSSLHPYIILLYDFQEDRFFSGNKRRLDFDFSTRAQVEAIATRNALDYFIINEQTSLSVMDYVIDIPPALQRLDLRDYLLPYLSQFGISDNPDVVPNLSKENFRIYPNPAIDKLNIEYPPEFLGANYEIFNLKGQKLAEGILNGNVISLNDKKMPPGKYILIIQKDKTQKTFSFFK